jgi:benzoate/toluate 1,2-dioxygenase beta subunit
MSNMDYRKIEQFLYLEARLQDEHRYEEWEALWADDACYWVPAGADDTDPATHVSYIYDNRSRIASRIRQLNTGRRHSQAPQSRMRRLISNIEITSESPLVTVSANFLLAEKRHGEVTTWAGRIDYTLRPEQDSFKLVTKKVMLVNNDEALPNMAFLI